ncbi:MAG: hypothetical protein WDM91_11090 [Rhizomicrobium sp.]
MSAAGLRLQHWEASTVAPASAGTAPFVRPKEEAIVSPMGIFVARKDVFDVFVVGLIGAPRILDRLFDELPLVEHGWSRSGTAIVLGPRHGDGFIWTVRRT